jgi:Linalool dehydratase/isomerase
VATGLRFGLALVVGAVVWLPSLHVLFAKDTSAAFSHHALPEAAVALAAPALRPDGADGAMASTHTSSDEWDLMGRTFTAWSLANLALRDPEHQSEYLTALDRILEETQRLESEHGFRCFLLPYGKTHRFRAQPERSLFVDGEIALMMGLRRLVADDGDARPLSALADVISESMSQGPVLSAESYPDECWTFCNAVALAALAVADAVDGTDHSALSRRWIEMARAKLVDKGTGLLVSRYRYDGDVMEGPEGSTIWMVAHALSVVDEPFARDQYDRAKKELGRSTLGFGYAVEWPLSAPGHADIDSGPIVPFFHASAGSSGLALVGAKTFGDQEYFTELMTTLEFAAFPIRAHGDSTLRYAASNPTGDAVLLYATVLGPAWDRVRERRKS